MSAIEQLGEAERERMFCDWGTPVVVRIVTPTAAMAAGIVTETKRDVVVTAIVRERTSKPTPKTALRHAATERDFVIRVADAPPEIRQTTTRLVDRDVEYAIVTSTVSCDGAVIVLQGQRV
jgi:hypothetical protein